MLGSIVAAQAIFNFNAIQKPLFVLNSTAVRNCPKADHVDGKDAVIWEMISTFSKM